MSRKLKGFTLVELMVVIAIVAILATIALPSYIDYVRKSRRADGMDALLNLQTMQERWRAGDIDYGTAAEIGAAATSGEGFYNLAVAGNTATGYTLTADPIGDQANDDEDGVACDPLSITVNAGNPRGLKAPAACW